MKILLVIIVVLALVVSAILITAAFQPNELHVQRSIQSKANAAEIYSIMSDLNRWPEWSPYQKRDPGVKTEITGAPGEVGATFAWDGNKEVGAGKMTILRVEPNKLIESKLEFYRPWEGLCSVNWRIDDEGMERRITWDMVGASAYMAKVVGLFLNMDKMVGGDFEAGLVSLKEIAERPATVIAR